jgi:hypothetical protein
MNRWHFFGRFLLAYFLALAIFGIMYWHSTKETAGILALALLFPAGLAAILRITSDPGWATVIGYVIYIALITLGVFRQSKALLCVFVVLLLLNLEGCYLVLKDAHL